MPARLAQGAGSVDGCLHRGQQRCSVGAERPVHVVRVRHSGRHIQQLQRLAGGGHKAQQQPAAGGVLPQGLLQASDEALILKHLLGQGGPAAVAACRRLLSYWSGTRACCTKHIYIYIDMYILA
jgi:hypothetical protein